LKNENKHLEALIKKSRNDIHTFILTKPITLINKISDSKINKIEDNMLNTLSRKFSIDTESKSRETIIIEKVVNFYKCCNAKSTFVSLFDDIIDKIAVLLDCKKVTLFVLNEELQKQ